MLCHHPQNLSSFMQRKQEAFNWVFVNNTHTNKQLENNGWMDRERYLKSSHFMLNSESTTTHHAHGCKFTRGEVRTWGHPPVPSDGQTIVAYGSRKCQLSPSTKINY